MCEALGNHWMGKVAMMAGGLGITAEFQCSYMLPVAEEQQWGAKRYWNLVIYIFYLFK